MRLESPRVVGDIWLQSVWSETSCLTSMPAEVVEICRRLLKVESVVARAEISGRLESDFGPGVVLDWKLGAVRYQPLLLVRGGYGNTPMFSFT